MAVLFQSKAMCLLEQRGPEPHSHPSGWFQSQALSAQMRISSQHANRCLIEETNYRKITTPCWDFSHDTKNSTSVPRSLYPDGLYILSTPQGLRVERTLAWERVPGGGQALKLENVWNLQAGLQPCRKIPVCSLCYPHDTQIPETARGQGSSCPFMLMGWIKHG